MNRNGDSQSLQSKATDRICDVMVSVLASSAVDRRFEPWSGQTKDYENGSCCYSVKHAALRKKKNQRQVGSESG